MLQWQSWLIQARVAEMMADIFREAAIDEVVISQHEVRRFVLDAMVKVTSAEKHAEQLADILVMSDYRGHPSHGINRLHVYLNDVESGACSVDGQPTVLNDKGATAWLDGNNLLGPVVGNFAMQLAINKAKKFGIGFVAVKGSNHFGIAGWYAQQALQEGLIGFAFTNTSPCVFPTRSSEKALGSNPICCAAAGDNDDQFFLDMACTTVAYGKLEVLQKKGDSHIPFGWAGDQNGEDCADVNKVLDNGGLRPLGSDEAHASYKGYGLCMMVELLTAVLAGATYGPNVRRWMTTESAANLGQSFMAIDPEVFAPGFQGRLTDLMESMRNLIPRKINEPVLIPGDPERKHMEFCDSLGGIVYHNSCLPSLDRLAKKLGIAQLQVKGDYSRKIYC